MFPVATKEVPGHVYRLLCDVGQNYVSFATGQFWMAVDDGLMFS